MKLRFAYNPRAERRELLAVARRGEELDLVRASIVTSAACSGFLEFACEPTGAPGGLPLLRYDVEGLVSLRSYLRKQRLGHSELMRLLEGLAGALAWCVGQRLGTEAMLFDARYVFVCADGAPHFAFVPLDGLPFSTASSPLTMLRALGDSRRLALVTPAARMLSERVADYVLRERDVFSLNSFRAFLQEERAGREGSSAGIATLAPGATLASATPASGAPLATILSSPEATQSHGPVDSRQDASLPTGMPDLRKLVGRGGVAHGPACSSHAASARVWLERLSTGETYALPEGMPVCIGRDQSCQVWVPGNAGISRRHASVQLEGDTLTVRDLGSTNGTFVGGRRLLPGERRRMPLDARFFLAHEEFAVCRDSSAASI